MPFEKPLQSPLIHPSFPLIATHGTSAAPSPSKTFPTISSIIDNVRQTFLHLTCTAGDAACLALVHLARMGEKGPRVQAKKKETGVRAVDLNIPGKRRARLDDV